VILILVFGVTAGTPRVARSGDGLIEGLVESVRNPTTPLAPAIDAVLSEHLVGDTTLGVYLETLHFEGCLDIVREDLVAGLDRLRAVHVSAVESRRQTRVWRTWERRLSKLSADAYLLVTTWLDSPETASRLFLCNDGLPASWKHLPPEAFVVEAVTWFDVAVAERERTIRAGVAADRDLAVMELMELRVALLDRFAGTYPEDARHQGAAQQMLERLGLMWQTLIEPWHTGFSPRGRLSGPEVDPQRKQKVRFQSPTGGILLPDPRELAVRERVVRSWRRQSALIDRDIKDNAERLQLALAALDSAAPAERDQQVRAAARLQAELDHSISDLQRMQNRIFHLSTGRAYVDSMLDRGFRRRAVRRLGRRERRLVAQRDRVEQAIAAAVAAGAAAPGSPRPDPNEGQPVDNLDEPGPGNWLAGLTMIETGASSPSTVAASGGIPSGTGWVERVYEGPLPTPSGTWSDDLVEAIQQRHVGLDETDVRILLGLVKLAYNELPGRSAVERAVWRSLAEGDGLRIRGEETSLSELWKPGLSHAEQPAVTFILTLYF